MKLSKRMVNAINDQVNAEFYSAYLYLAMAAYFENLNLRGFSHWMKAQADEELEHGMKLYDYLLERGGVVSLARIDKPPQRWASPLAVFQASLKHEQKVTGLINKLYNLAKSEKDHATEIALQWFVTEQVEEESSVAEIIEKLKVAGEKGPGLLMLDRELAGRKND